MYTFFRLRSVFMSQAVCELLPLCVYAFAHSWLFFCIVSVCISSLHRPHLFRKQTEESLNWQCTFGVRVHILWTIAQQKGDDCMIRPRQAILCLFEEEGAPSSPEQVFLQLFISSCSSRSDCHCILMKISKEKCEIQYKVPFLLMTYFFPQNYFFSLTSHNQTDTQCRWRACSVNSLLLTSPNPPPRLHVRIPLFSD